MPYGTEKTHIQKKIKSHIGVKPGFTQRCPCHSIFTMALAAVNDYGSKIHLILPVLILFKVV